MKKVIVIHYDEIGTKGANRPDFEKAFLNDIKRRFKNLRAQDIWGRILVFLEKENTFDYKRILKQTPGVATFGSGYFLDKDVSIDKIGEFAIALFDSAHPTNFAVRVKRVDKSVSGTSQEFERKIGEHIFEYFNKQIPVKLSGPEFLVAVEFLHKGILVYRKEKGIGGLPVGVSGKAISLLSGGFDSPVATYRLIKRGVIPVGAHFHGMPKTSPKAIEKVMEISRILSNYTGDFDLYLIPTLDAMQEIAKKVPDKLRLIILRRFMMRVVNNLANQVDAKAIITGESVGQVASQTLANLGAIAEASKLPILRPLSGDNKNEIINEAREIGTHDISAQPHDDTCSLFVPKHPETNAKLKEVLEAEALYDIDKLIKYALENTELKKINYVDPKI